MNLFSKDHRAQEISAVAKLNVQFLVLWTLGQDWPTAANIPATPGKIADNRYPYSQMLEGKIQVHTTRSRPAFE